MAPAQIECMQQQPDVKFAWTPVRTVATGASEILHTNHGDVRLEGTKHGFSLKDGEKPLDDVSATDTDEFTLSTGIRRVTTKEGELQIRAVEEK